MQQSGAAAQLHVEAPLSELNNFDLYLTPSQEIMSDAQMLMQQFSNLGTWVTQRIQSPNGLNMVSSVFSDLISRGQAMNLVMALNSAFGQQQPGLSAQTGATGTTYTPALTGYTLAVIDQITRMDLQKAGEAIYWALSGAGGQELARQMVAALDTFQAHIGCSEPAKSSFRFAAEIANMQMSSPMGGQNQGTPANFVTWISQSPQLMACFESAYGNYPNLMQQAGGAAGGAGGAGGNAGGAGAGGAGGAGGASGTSGTSSGTMG